MDKKTIPVKTVVIWSLINKKNHPALTKELLRSDENSSLITIASTMFPGINYYSLTGAFAVRDNLIIPAFKTMFPELLTTPAEKITAKTNTEVSTFLPSNGYQWEDSQEWQLTFKKMLETWKKAG